MHKFSKFPPARAGITNEPNPNGSRINPAWLVEKEGVLPDTMAPPGSADESPASKQTKPSVEAVYSNLTNLCPDDIE